MDYYYLLKLTVVGFLAWVVWVNIYITYNFIKSKKIFLNQSKEMQEKYKPFYRNDVKNWTLFEPIFYYSWLYIPFFGIMFIFFCI